MDIVMPKLGLTMVEGTITRWLKAEGEAIEKGEPLFEFETDKSTLEIESPVAGTLSQILAPVGSVVPVLRPVARIKVAGEQPAAPGRKARRHPGAAEQGPQPVDARVTLESGEPVRPKATPKARRTAKAHELDLAAIQGSGPGGRIVAADVERAIAGRVASPDNREMGGREGALATEAPPRPSGKSGADAQRAETRGIQASPVARRLAQDAGLDLTAIPGTGPRGRIVKGDVEARLRSALGGAGQERDAPAVAGAGVVEEATPAGVEVTPITGVRAVIARRMAESAQTTAATSLSTRVDATELVRVRETLRAEWQASPGMGPSYNDLLLVILAKALRELPYMNAHLVGGEIRRFEAVNIGLAIDTERGLLVPVLHGAERMTLREVAQASRDLVSRARAGHLLPDELSGGTFTLTNMGMFEIDAFTPIINIPEVAILGMGRIVETPAVCGGQVCVRKMLTLSLTFDHRAVDGAPAARLLQRVKQLVEQPSLALVR